jgi:bifunctional DNA-binding transcriptional regulator/antitoxin component of YhaV-PrlF toxin-antitoxin module
MQINLGNTRGLKRKMNGEGRVTLPREFRKELDIADDDEVTIFLLKNGIYIEKGEK